MAVAALSAMAKAGLAYQLAEWPAACSVAESS